MNPHKQPALRPLPNDVLVKAGHKVFVETSAGDGSSIPDKLYEREFAVILPSAGQVPGVAPANVAILGGSIVGTNAAKLAVGLGAHVTLRLWEGLGDRFPSPKPISSVTKRRPVSVFCSVAQLMSHAMLRRAVRFVPRGPIAISPAETTMTAVGI